MKRIKDTKLGQYFKKDVKEFNKYLLSLVCIAILVTVGLISYYITNSYAIFTDSIEGSETLELTNVNPTKPAAEVLISKVGQSGLTKITHPADNTLQIGATEDIDEYRYVGPNSTVTNNYVNFNNDTYRIIGVFPTDDGTGKIENRIKLIKASSIENQYWNSNGTNNWTEATLNTYLNETFYNSLDSASKNLIGNAKYYLGGYDRSSMTKDVMYTYERKTSGSSYYYGSNPTSWTGKIGLMYASDYGYAVSSACTKNLYEYNDSSCKNNDWLYLGSNEWILPQNASYSSYAFIVRSGGYVGDDDYRVDDYQFAVRPVLYLMSGAQITGGDGSSGNPYTFGIGGGQEDPTPSSNSVYSLSASYVNIGDSLDSISGYTTDYTSLSENYFLKHNIGSDNKVESQELCYILNNNLYCLKGGDEGASYESNKQILLESFGESNCSVDSDGVACSAYGLSASAYDDGDVLAYDVDEGCRVNVTGNAYCI